MITRVRYIYSVQVEKSVAPLLAPRNIIVVID